MATKEPLRRCVRCKTKKKGCSRGNPCERCALAGLTADECIYLESDSTFRSIKPKKKDATSQVPKVAATKSYKVVSVQPESGAIIRCSRCIRTARGCSHERPCEPCRQNGLSEWECRYTSASSFKVRGPGVRKVKSLERLSVQNAITSDGDEETVQPIHKQDRSHSTNSGHMPRSQLALSSIPLDYRTPSPPTNISPISDNVSEDEREEALSPLVTKTAAVETRQLESHAVPIPRSQYIPNPAPTSDASKMLRQESNTHLPAGSVEPPPMVTLIPSMSQQSHANTIPESSPAVYTDDYQSSPSPFNSPQFQSSPPVHYQSIVGTSGLASDQPMYPPQAPYRPPGGYVMQAQARQYAAAQAQHGFVPIPQNGRAQQHQQAQNLAYSQSPPYVTQHYIPQHLYSTSPGPRHRAVPSPAPRHASPGPYAIPQRHHGYQVVNQSPEGRLQVFQVPHQQQQQSQSGVPIRLKHQAQYPVYANYGTSPSEVPSHSDALTEFKDNLTRQSSQANSNTPEQGADADLSDFGREWQEEIGIFEQQMQHE